MAKIKTNWWTVGSATYGVRGRCRLEVQGKNWKVFGGVGARALLQKGSAKSKAAAKRAASAACNK